MFKNSRSVFSLSDTLSFVKKRNVF